MCLCCDKNCQKRIDENLKKRFTSIYKFANQDINKFILLLRKVVYPYEYMGGWEKYKNERLPEKEDFYSHLNIEDITDEDYKHAKRVFKDFKIKK